MTKARIDGLCLLLMGSIAFIFLGFLAESVNPAAMMDFKQIYYGAQCLLQHRDPYNVNEVLRVYQTDGGEFPSAPIPNRLFHRVILVDVNLPATLSFFSPVAVLAPGPAEVLSDTLTAVSLIFASLLIWRLDGNSAPVISGALFGLLLANSEVLLMVGNVAGIAVSLCVVSVWCFVRERFIPAGILCLAASLAIKPHDAGLVWLYFLLAGGVYRKRALQTLLATVAVSLPGVLWVWRVAPHWIQEWRLSIVGFTAHGALNDPTLASTGGRAVGMMINLQTVLSYFWKDPRIYNSAAYLICATLLLAWAFATLRSRPSPMRIWLALAAISALAMLPVYHRPYDAKLLLLSIPACAMLWAEGGLIGRLALLINTGAIVLTGDLIWIILFSLFKSLHLSTTGMAGRSLTAMQVFAIPMMLLVMSIFYLWVYMRRSSPADLSTASAEPS